jgi:hypothetical protein
VLNLFLWKQNNIEIEEWKMKQLEIQSISWKKKLKKEARRKQYQIKLIGSAEILH